MKTKMVTIGPLRLYCGDAAAIVPQITGQVDCVITDPPYAERTHQGARTNRKSAEGKRLVPFPSLSDSQFLAAVEQWLAAAGGWVVATVDMRHAALLMDHPKLVRLGVWVKNNPMPQLTGDRPAQGHETVLVMHSGARRKAWNRGGGPATWRHNVCNRATVPTEKPLALVRDFVYDFTQPDEMILDPYMGAGTTGAACLLEGRRFIGIERDPQHFKIAVTRLTNLHAHLKVAA